MKKLVTKLAAFVVVGALIGTLAWQYLPRPLPAQWSAEQASLINSLSLTKLPALPADPSNRVADDPVAKTLGHRLYFDTRLSSNGQVSCATCHRPELMFSDGQTLAVGLQMGPRHAPGLVGVAYSPWFYWDGRKDSQWAQALAPLEAAVEHDMDRVSIVRLFLSDPNYRELYEQLFEPLPEALELPTAASPVRGAEELSAWNAMPSQDRNAVDRIFANLGKTLAAYQREIMPGRTDFDRYADLVLDNADTNQGELLSDEEIAGLALFIDKAQCITCHNGPLLTNHEFHNTGVMAIRGELPSMGRYDGVRIAREDPFNCLGQFSDASAADCIELRFARDENDLVGAQKTPTLRNITLTAPYMHGGQIETLTEVVAHYNDAPTSMLSHNEAKPLGLRSMELRQLEAFLRTLTAPLATEEKWLSAPEY